MRWFLAALLLMALTLVPGSSNPPNLGSPYFSHVQDTFENVPKSVGVLILCRHRETVEDMMDIFEAQTNEKPSTYMLEKHIKVGECYQLPRPIEMSIDEVGPLRSNMVIVEGASLGQGIAYRAIRVQKFWTAMASVIYQR